jgi:predicted phosphodiesterase
MKVLIISDVHANLPALEAVLNKEKTFDICLFLGDVVDYGPNPKECISIIKDIADYSVTGNHDNALAFNVDCNCMGTFREYSIETRKWHTSLLDDEEKSFLKSLPLLNK